MVTTLIVTEKPDAALHVAEALGVKTEPSRFTVGGVPFFEVQRGEERIVVCSALGHLYAVTSKREEARAQYPVWDFEWRPKHLVERGQERQKKWIESIAKVSASADRFINACDYDVEGSLIGYTILKYACHGAEKKAQRMKFSTLTSKELQDAYSKLAPELDFQLAYAGMCRHEIDWLYGINLSRALTQAAYKASKRYSTLSTGRVQGPTLRFVVERERKIATFVPTPHWTIKTTIDVKGQTIEAAAKIERFEVKTQAESTIRDCIGKKGTIEELESRTYHISPPTPFDLTALQTEAYRHFLFAPKLALSIAERLYLDQLVSYPRTSSQKLPSSIGYADILRNLGNMVAYRAASTSILTLKPLQPNEGQKKDPAHPAIYPTGSTPKRHLDLREQKIFDLIVRRFLATFAESATKQSEKATIKVGDHEFYLHGSRILKKGWISIYAPYAKFDEVTLPALSEGQEVTVENITLEEKYAQPPPRYNPSSLLKTMEDAEIGTKATRADIIETLVRRGYMKDQRMEATQLAFRVTEILTAFCPRVIDVAFTRELEAMMTQIEQGNQTHEHVIQEAINDLKPIVEDLKTNENAIGKELTTIIRESWQASITLSVPCPRCGSKLRVVKNPNTKKRFIGCSGKWEKKCVFSLPLPQLGSLTLLAKRCPECGFQMVQVRSKGRRPMISCSNCFVNKSMPREPSKATLHPKLQE
jgi:DNA topoisomerase I